MTKTNLTLLTIGLVAASLLASCKKNDNGGTADGQGFKASIEQSANGSGRTHGVDDGNGHINVVWNDADQILVSNNNGGTATPATLTYQLTEGKNNSNGTFYTGAPHDDFFHPNYAAIYPAQNTEGTENSLSGTTATFYLPAIQPYAGTEIFASKVVPMVAYSSNQTLSFKNACGGLRFPMVGSGITVKRVELTTNSFNTNQHLSGKFEVDCSASDPILDWKSDGGNTITIDCGSGITLDNTTTYFYFMLPPGTLDGLSLTAYDNNNQVVYHAENETDYEIVRNKIKKVGANLEIPLEVTTVSPTYITATSAKGGVSVSNGTARETGICWGLSNTPDINGSPAQGTTAISMTGLRPNTIYYVRAYAKSANNTVYYGEAIPFATRGDYANNKGKLPGQFSVASGLKYNFSMGNLQYQASTNTWRYAKRQFDYVGYQHAVNGTMQQYGTVMGSNNDDVSSSYNGWVDVFQWGTSNRNHGATQTKPWSRWNTDNDYNHFFAYGDWKIHLFDYSGEADWGYNAISNGGNIEGRDKFTPNSAQMNYLLYTRSGNEAPDINNTTDARFAFARLNINDTIVKGIMLFPDVMTWPSTVGYPTHINGNNGNNPFPGGWDDTDFTTFTEREWSLLEHAGVVFLPCAGCWGAGSEMDNWGNYGGRYWLSDVSSSEADKDKAYAFAFSPQHVTGEGIVYPFSITQRTIGFAVRLLINPSY